VGDNTFTSNQTIYLFIHVKWFHAAAKQLLLKSINSVKAKVHIYISYLTHYVVFFQVIIWA